jgi:hypothetical protein
MRLVDRRLKGDVDLLLHDGDIGYHSRVLANPLRCADIWSHWGRYADGYQPLWDAFLRKMETVGAFIPVMTAPGNHEGTACLLLIGCFQNRFPVWMMLCAF